MRYLFIVMLALISWAGAALADSVSYTYDAFGRVQTIVYANGTTITYSYDNADNRSTQTVTCGTSGC
jgi:YD repeat-containing protein